MKRGAGRCGQAPAAEHLPQPEAQRPELLERDTREPQTSVCWKCKWKFSINFTAVLAYPEDQSPEVSASILRAHREGSRIRHVSRQEKAQLRRFCNKEVLTSLYSFWMRHFYYRSQSHVQSRCYMHPKTSSLAWEFRRKVIGFGENAESTLQ